MPLNPFFAQRTLIIKRENSPLEQGESLYTVHILDIPHNGESADEVIGTISEILDRTERGDGFAISDRRSIYEAGASNSAQEVTITIYDAIISGTAEAVVGALILWGATKFAAYKKAMGMTMNESNEYKVGRAFTHIKTYYGGIGELTLEEERKTGTSYEAIIRDSIGNRFRFIDEGKGIETIVKLSVGESK